MDEKLIRERIRLKLALGLLKHYDGMIVRTPIGGSQPCQACGRQIDPDTAAPHGHAYAIGTQWFHLACHALWKEERTPTASEADIVRGTTRSGRSQLTP